MKEKDIERATEYSELSFQQELSIRDRAEADAHHDRRMLYQECKFCYYFRQGLAGQAFTWYKCECCGAEAQHPNTRVPKLCSQCATTYKCCRRCFSRL